MSSEKPVKMVAPKATDLSEAVASVLKDVSYVE
jgi:hypothetical protein